MATNVLENGVEIVGTIEFAGDLHLDCKVKGEIKSASGSLVLNRNAQVEGDVSSGQLTVHGKVDGGVTAQTCILDQTAELKGDLSYKSLEMKPGAKLIGSMKMIG